MVGSSAIPRIHLFLMFSAWRLGVCRLGRHIMIETSAVWLERYFVASDPCLLHVFAMPVVKIYLVFLSSMGTVFYEQLQHMAKRRHGHTGHGWAWC